MSLFGKLFGRSAAPVQRVRVCVECGMPLPDHKDWCAILRGQNEMNRKTAPAAAQRPANAT
jgi:hypothetical protein